jgi:multicomponent K+:H+ antiporter subunit E
MISQRQWFPHPTLSIFMWILWLLLVNSLSGGHIILGGLLAWAIPYLTQSFWPGSMVIRKPGVALKFVLVVTVDVIVANFQVAGWILGSSKRLRPAFMVIPLDVERDFTITILANTISLTPGTVSADLDIDKRQLLVHALNVDDIAAAVAQIKQRYEAPLKEIFE